MAARAVVHDPYVIHRCAREVGEFGCRVASFTGERGRYVVDWFRYRCHTQEHLTVVARCTTTGDT